MEQQGPQRRRSSVAGDASAQPRPAPRSSQSGLSPSSSSLEPQQAPSFSLEGLGPSSQHPFLPHEDAAAHPPPVEDGEPDPFFAGHELYRALRGSQADDPLTDELLWEGDFMSTQRDFIQKKQQDELLERLERRMGRVRAAPVQRPQSGVESASTSAGGAEPAAAGLAGLAMAAATGVRLKNLLGRVMASGTATSDGSSVSSVAGAPAAGLLRSAISSAPGQLTVGQPADGRLAAGPAGSTAVPAVAPEQGPASRLLARVTSSLRGRPAAEPGAAAGGLGVLVAADDSNMQAGADTTVAGPAAGAAETAPQQASPFAAATAAGAAATATAAELPPADAVVQVVKAEKKLTPKELEAQEKAKQEELQRMDTETRLQMEIDSYSWVRRTAVKICTQSDFELFVVLLIFGNCISLALYDPLQPDDSYHNATLTKFDLGLNVAFTVEMFLRILSMGGIFAYLHHPWNVFDCIMVLAGYTTFIPTGNSSKAGLDGVKALRALRALRPLRTITRFAALRSIVVCFLEAVPLLVSVAAMLFFFLFLFAVAGVEIFGDVFHYYCADPATGNMEKDAVPIQDEFSCGARTCPPEFSECREYSNSMATQIAGFENVATSMLTVFQAMTLTNWSFSMYRTMDFLSPAVVIYWLVLIIFGSYFVLNLFLAVLKCKFAKAKNLLDEKRRQRRAMKAARGDSKRQNVLAKAAGWMKHRVASYVSSKAGQDSLSSHVAEVVAKKSASEYGDFGTPRSNLTGFTELISGPTDAQEKQAGGTGTVQIAAPDGNTSVKPPVNRQLSRMDSAGSGMSGYSGMTGMTGMTGVSAVSTECLLSIEEFDESVQDLPWLKRSLLSAQYRVRVLVCSSWFNNFFLLAIVANTVCLAIVYDGMTHEVDEALALANFVFTGLFTLEMLLKLAGLGPWKYLSDPWSLFDAVVVAFSLVELVTELMARTSAHGLTALRSVRSLRVLRSFRVLRVMKMFKYLESLKMIAAVLISSMTSFASIVILLVLFWMVFSIVGLHVFGGLDLDIPWPNCNSLINSAIINFHILNLENFQISMFSIIRATNLASSVFWLAWIILGKYIFLTLFLAVVLDAFERKYEADMRRGVRSQSMASSIFSRIKKAGQRVKSMAASVASAGSRSGKSAVVSIWKPNASRGVGGMFGKDSNGSNHGGSNHGAAGSQQPAMVLPGQASADGLVVATVAAGSTHAHVRPHSSTEQVPSRRTSVDGPAGHRVSHDRGPGRRTSIDASSAANSAASHHHHHGHHQHHQHHHHGGEHQHDRRGSSERRRSVELRAGTSGPVAESVLLPRDYSGSFGTGLRLRRLRAGMQQQFGCLQQQQQLEPLSSMSYGWGGSSSLSSSKQAAAAAAAEAYQQQRRSSSSSGGSSSGANSFILKQQAAAAFAASAASDALRPCHVLPDLLGDDFFDALNLTTSFGAAQGGQQQLFGSSSSRSTNPWELDSLKSSEQRSSVPGSLQLADEDGDFTWQEFLATVAAINHPVVYRLQQLRLQQQEQQLLLTQPSKAAPAAAATTAAAGPGVSARASAALGPIAEGFEGPAEQGVTVSPTPKRGSFETGRISFSTDGGQVTARSLAAPATAHEQRHTQTSAAADSGAHGAGHHTPPRLHQLALDDIDKELTSLGMQPTTAEPATPSLLFPTAQSSAAGTGQESLWPGLNVDTEEYLKSHQASSTPTPAAVASTAAEARPAEAASSNGTDAATAAAQQETPPALPEPKPAKDPARRVTLFTESMRNRGECPAPPRSPRFDERRGSRGGIKQHLSSSGALNAKLDELLQQSGFDDPSEGAATAGSAAAANGSDTGKGGSRSASAGSTTSAAALLALGGVSVEPAVTAQAIRRRKAAALALVPEQSSCGESAPQGIAEAAGQLTTNNLHATFAEEPAGSEGQSQASSTRRTSRAFSDTGSEGGLSDGGQSRTSGAGSQSGAWSTFSGMGRSRSRTFPELSGVSLWLFPQENRFRQAIYDLVTNKYFDYVMFALIMLNCVAMAYEYPTMSKENLDGVILFWSDVVFTAAFTLEAGLKIVAFGFRPYMSFFQNQVDILIVASSLVMLFLDSLTDLHVIKGLRVLRAIKPLRALTRSAGMQLIFKSLTLSLAAMGNVSIVVLLFFLIFAILGVQLFHGKFWSCNDDSVPDKDSCVGTFMLGGAETPRVWSNMVYNFDNLGMALVSLFVVATLNGYAEMMDAAMAAPEEPGLQPQPMSNWSAFFFFVAFVLVVAYTLLNMYIGVVFYQFSRIRMQSQTGSAFLTDDQTEWVEMSKLVFRLKPPEKSPVPVNKLRRKLYYMVQGKPFEYAIMCVIIANSALMATAYYNQPEVMTRVVESINYAFTGIYLVEFCLKVVGLGWPNYWKVSWNKFDLLLLITGIVDMLVTLLVGPGVAGFLKIQKILRLLRLARVVKLMRSMKGLRSLFGTLIVSLPAFWNVGGLLGLMFFIYAYIGMLLLGHIKRNGGLNEHTNFERFWSAALTLFKVATNDNWTDVMSACLIGPPDCDPSADCGSWVAYPYFISFVVLVTMIMLQLFTAVIIESFEAQEEQDRWKLRPDHLDEFVELWAEYDDGSGTIDPKDLEAMLLRLSPPLGLGKSASSTDVLRFVFDLDIPLINGRVPFQRTAYELVRRCSGAEIPEGLLKDQINKLVTRAFRNLKADEVLNFSVAVTVMRVQRKWRARMRAAKMKRKKEFRADRGIAPAYADIIASRDTTMKAALQRRQAGDLRWRPHPAYTPMWAAAEAVLAAEAAAAAAAACRRRSSGSSSGAAAEVGPGGRWSSLAGLKASADGWMQRMTGGLTGGLQRIKGAGGGLFRRETDTTEGARSARSSIWGFGSRATSKAASTAATSAAASTAATSRAASRAASQAISEASSMAVSEVGTVDSAAT